MSCNDGLNSDSAPAARRLATVAEPIHISAAHLRRCLPHGPPFIWLDEVTVFPAVGRAIGTRLYHAADPVFDGHFPGDPVLPGVIIVEALAQTGGVLLAVQNQSGPLRGTLAKIDVRFYESVRPGSTLTTDVTLSRRVNSIVEFACEAYTTQGPVATGRVVISTVET